MSSKKIQTIINWKKSNSVWDVQFFLDFANFHQIFIQNSFNIATPLIRLIHKDKLKWNAESDQAFETMKNMFITLTILLHLDFLEPFSLKIDALNFDFRMVLSQPNKEE